MTTADWDRTVRLADAAPTWGPHHRIVADVGLRKIAGNEHAYWTATATIVDTSKHRRSHDFEVACGCLHDDIVAVFPETAPIVALHLSDEDGTPMHAAANALHWFGLTYTTLSPQEPWEPWPQGREHAARHLRCSLADVDAHREYVATDPNPPEAMGYLIRAVLAPTWKAEAAEAHAWLDARVPR